ncbi:nuclear factor of activated T-cells, cytoplasmic 1-like [Lutra lutra]|uniref:nuclear factor of activated T-cells, cytoplasmic 1-like n=1 Tax=Lutra lutra TaxID=9657 RepID=UPI001FD00B02|nr:nuclear factor of activated T-cells, cytoplasmic 1-like [Lutra lutra]
MAPIMAPIPAPAPSSMTSLPPPTARAWPARASDFRGRPEGSSLLRRRRDSWACTLGPPSHRPPALLRPQPCGPARPSATGHQLPQRPKAPRSESTAPRPLPPPEVREDGSRSLAPIPVTVKREPQDLDQLYLDDVNEIIRNDLSSTNI